LLKKFEASYSPLEPNPDEDDPQSADVRNEYADIMQEERNARVTRTGKTTLAI
jgi:hypothetical protein